MGWTAETVWNLEFESAHHAELCRQELNQHFGVGDITTMDDLIGHFHEAGELWFATPTHLTGGGGGKSWSPGQDENFDETVYDILAKHVEGTIDWNDEDCTNPFAGFWRIRFHDGHWTAHSGKVVWLGDEHEAPSCLNRHPGHSNYLCERDVGHVGDHVATVAGHTKAWKPYFDIMRQLRKSFTGKRA